MHKKSLSILLIMAMLIPFAVSLAHEADLPIGLWEECEQPTDLPETVTIGAIFGLSGNVAVYGTSQQSAVQLAVDQINENHYLGENTALEVIFEDSAGDREQAIAAMTKLVEEDQVVGVLGPTLSAEAFAADPVAQENSTVVMGVSNTAIGITDMGDFVFRDSLPEQVVIPGTIAQATEILGLEGVGILYGNDDDFTVSGYEVFQQALADNGVEILGEETFATGDVDFNAQLTNLIGAEPDALVVSALAAEAVQIIIQARDLGYTGPIIGGNGFNSPAVLRDSGADSEGLIVGGAWNYGNPNPSESSVAFVEAFEEAYDTSPDQFAAQAYTGAWLLATAIRCGNSVDRTAVRDALAEIQDFDSPLGVFSFDENHEPLHDPIAQIVQDGAFVPLSVAMGEEGTEPEETASQENEEGATSTLIPVQATTTDTMRFAGMGFDFGNACPSNDNDTLLIVFFDGFEGDIELSDEDRNWVVLSSDGSELTSIGLALVAPGQTFQMIGAITGDISSPSGGNDALLGLVYVISKEMSEVTLVAPDGTNTILPISSD